MKRSSVVAWLVVVLAVISAACGDTIRPAAATINGDQISQETLDGELKAIASNSEYVGTVEQSGFKVRGGGRGTLSNEFVGRVLTRQIFLRLIHDEFVRKDLEVDDADLDLAKSQVLQSVGTDEVFERFPKDYRQTLLRRAAEVAKLQQALGGEDVTDEKVRAFYDENPDRFASTCVSHILLGAVGPDGQLDQEATAAQIDRLKEEAAVVRADIVAGADFATIAAQRSVDASNKDKGGDLECGPKGRFVPEFETAMDALAPNEVSAPVPTMFGVHLIKVTDRKPQAFEEAEPQIRQELQGEGQQKFSEFLERAVAKAKISVNPRYGKFRKDGQAPGVVPPGAPTTTSAGESPADTGGQGIPLQP